MQDDEEYVEAITIQVVGRKALLLCYVNTSTMVSSLYAFVKNREVEVLSITIHKHRLRPHTIRLQDVLAIGQYVALPTI